MSVAADEGQTVTLSIKVENAYSDGHESERVETVQVAPFSDLEQLWDQLWAFTGDGHGVGRDGGYCHIVTVVGCFDRPELVGLSNEWAGA